MLAETAMQVTWQRMRWLEDQKDSLHGPTYLLLLDWEKRGWTLEDFRKAMEDIGRYDVADEVGTFLQNNRVGVEENV